MFIIIPGAFNAQTGVPGASQQGQVVTVGSILKVTERDRRPYPTDVGTPSEIWIDNTAGIGYICKELDTGHGTVWDKLDLLGDFVTFGDNDPGVNIDIKLGYRPGSLRYSRNSEILWICKDNTQGAAVWEVVSSGGGVVSVNGLTGVVQLYLDDLMDVDAASPTDGDVLTWDSATSTWIATPSTSSITLVASEGLKLNPSNPYDVQLGSAIDNNTALITGPRYITTDNLGSLNIRGTMFDPFGKGIFHVENQFVLSGGQTPTAITGYSTGRGITGYSFGSGIFSSGVFADALTGYGLYANSNTGISIKSVSQRNKIFEGVRSADISEAGSIVEMAYYLRKTDSSLGTAGVGMKFIYDVIGGNAGSQVNEIVHKWIDVTSGTQLSQYEIWGNRYGTLEQHFTLKGTGQLQLNNYTGNTFDTTAFKTLGVDTLGNVITFDGGGGPSTPYTVNSGLSIDSTDPNNFQLGATTNALSLLLHDTYINLDDYAFHINGGTASTYNLLIDKPGVSNSEITIDNSSFNLQTTTIATDIVAGLDITSSFNGAASLRRTNTVSGRYSGFYFINDKLGWNVTDNITQYEYELPPAGTGYTAGALTDKLGNGKLSWETVSSGGLEYAIASGTNTYAVTIAGVTAYTDGDIYSIKFTNGNTAASTITINGITPAQHLHKSVSTSLASGDIISGQVLIIQYDGANFQVIGIAGGTGNLPTGGTAGQILEKIDSTNYNVQWADNISSIQHIQQYVKNDQGATVSKGQAVYMNGADGTNATIKLAQADTELTSSKTLGLLEQDLNNNAKGYVITEGLLSGLDTSAATADGDPVWLSPTTPGGLVYGLAAKPSAPSHLVFIGIVIRKNASNGEIYVKVQNGFELKELHDVQAQSPTNNDTLYYDNVTTPLKPQWKTQSVNNLLNTSIKTGSFGVTVDGVSSTIQVGQTGFVVMPYAGTITGWSITTNAVGSIQFDVWKDVSIDTIPTVADSIVGGVYPTLTTNQLATSTLVGAWTTAFSAGHVFGFYVNSVSSTVKNATLTLRCTKT